ncbi:MAG: hypothetical protein JXR96_28265 [Deltaproteobacteria bacterium]|nr:hypothetical protein [Deltaproteobacteria bacterium]
MIAASLLNLSVFMLAASVQPAAVPARGPQEAIVRIDEPGMYRLSARSDVGTACQVVDHFRGPFSASGRSGKTNCELDLLLDSGRYKMRLESPKDGKGQARIEVSRFTELHASPTLLPSGRSADAVLPAGSQASWWIRLEERQQVSLTVIGRTAGVVRLWRAGQWVTELASNQSRLMPRSGQSLHHWTLSGMLEAGDYLLSVYGTNVQRWTEGQERDFLYVANGFAPGPEERSLDFTLPDWGWLAVQIPLTRPIAFASLDQAPESPLTCSVIEMGSQKGDSLGSTRGTCRVMPKALIPTCSAYSSRRSRHVLVLTGEPGTRGRLQWSDYVSGSELDDSTYTGRASSFWFRAPGSGRYLVASDDVPLDPDAAPLSCELGPVRHVRYGRTYHDGLQVGRGRVFERAFNYEGHEASIRFEVTDAGVYEIESGEQRGVRCELFRPLESGKLDRLSESQPQAKRCQLSRHLPPGPYVLKLYEGTSGIEELKIRHAEAGPNAVKATKNGCRFLDVKLERDGRYQMRFDRLGRTSARGLMLRELPLKLERSLALTLDAHERMSLPVRAGAAIEVRAVGQAAFSCGFAGGEQAQAVRGVCKLEARSGKGQLELANAGGESIHLSLRRPRPPAPVPPLVVHKPQIEKLPELKPGQVRFFDFDRGQSHSLVFDVDQAGLYHLTTEGLLSTECRVRTPIVTQLATDRASGRGRNCLVASYMRPGRYLLTVQTVGPSRGRSGIAVRRRPVVSKPGLAGEGESFFRSAADELVQQTIEVKQAGRHRLGTTGQGVSLQCRLEDAEGWPLIRVPSSCQLTMDVPAGRLLWSQLPLTVESMRRTELEMIRPPEVLRGEKRHWLELNRSYTAALGEDGKDDFGFRVPAKMTISFQLDRGMQGRIYAKRMGKPKRKSKRFKEVIGLIPPGGGAVDLDLAPGAYCMLTEHSRADVGIRYRLMLSSRGVLAPGLKVDLHAPGTVRVLVPSDGVLRLGSSGSTDVRCRLFDAQDRLVAESGDTGADWNCLLARPVQVGAYRLALEAENGIPGPTSIWADLPKVEQVGELKDGQTLEAGRKALLASLPRSSGGVVQEVGFESKRRFSCALEDGSGEIREMHEDVKRCGFLVLPGKAPSRVRLWTRRYTRRIQVKMVTRPVEPSSGKVARAKAGRVRIPRAGLYETARKVWCLPASESGALRFCGGRSSLPAGEVVFSTTGPEDKLELALREIVLELDRPSDLKLEVDDLPAMQRARSGQTALHLLHAELSHGRRGSLACRMEGGVALQEDGRCFAASPPARESLSSWWLADDSPREARIRRLAAAVPSSASQLAPGVHSLLWSGAVARYRLPPGACRIDLVLPPESWAVRTDSKGAPVDLCPPVDRLGHCVLGGASGELLIYSNSERRARARLMLVSRAAGRGVLKGVYERWPHAAGVTRLEVPAAGFERHLIVDGAERCLIALDDGARLAGCRLQLPAGRGGELWIEHGKQPFRALTAKPGLELLQRWSHPLALEMPTPFERGQAARLTGEMVDYAFQLERPSMVQLRSDAGVCALMSTQRMLTVEGEDGCDIQRLLEAGVYRFMVRSFAGRPLSGSMVWTDQPVPDLEEGVSGQEWVIPGEARIFRFRVLAAGHIGLGLRADADLLECKVLDPNLKVLGTGCHQYRDLDKGTYLLEVRCPGGSRPMRFRPVLLGLSGTRSMVPASYLDEFFRRIGFEK